MTYKFSRRVPKSDEDPVGNILKVAGSPKVISFAGGLPAPELFPVDELRESSNEFFKEDGRKALQYATAFGYPKLRATMAKRMAEQGIQTNSDHILMTTGSQQSIDLVSKMFVNEGDVIICEKPTYLCALDVFRSYGAKIIGVDMDDDGMKMDQLAKTLEKYPEAKFIYTIPNFQNPTGRTMPADRRKEMIKLANQYDVMIMEDDPYGAIRFAGTPVNAVKSFDTEGRVIYLSTFSKILAPGMRIGWIVAEPDLIKRIAIMKQSADLHSDNVSQYIAEKFIENYDIDAHIEEIKKVYRKREGLMMTEIEANFPNGVKYSHPEGGLFIWVEVPGVDTQKLFQICVDHDVAFVPGEPFYPDEVVPGTFRLNYSNMNEEQIKTGIKRLGAAINEVVG